MIVKVIRKIKLILVPPVEAEVVADQKKARVEIQIDDDHDQGKTTRKNTHEIQY